MIRKPTSPARILKHRDTYTAVDSMGIVIERGTDAVRLAVRVAMVYGVDVDGYDGM